MSLIFAEPFLADSLSEEAQDDSFTHIYCGQCWRAGHERRLFCGKLSPDGDQEDPWIPENMCAMCWAEYESYKGVCPRGHVQGR